MNDIDGLIVSYMVHKAKPDPAIYAALCEKYELNPSECLFFDDRSGKCTGGDKLRHAGEAGVVERGACGGSGENCAGI